MSDAETGTIKLYTSRWCAHALSVEGFLERNHITVQRIDIDRDPADRQRLIEINGGYASVPTLIFPDGSKLTEPSLSELRQKLKLEAPPGLLDRLRRVAGRGGDD
ncbi:MAG: glutaredoxin domain-containing protein [Candidatus Promineifilaceae bacterium]|nr:glutaredoxin domain-containing protein [Candidatus Promineifilaceae bacterium]